MPSGNGYFSVRVADFVEFMDGGPVATGPEQPVPVTLATSERNLIVERTPAGPWLKDRLREAKASRGKLTVSYLVYELHELLGAVALGAHCTEDRLLVARLDKLYVRLESIETSFIKARERESGG